MSHPRPQSVSRSQSPVARQYAARRKDCQVALAVQLVCKRRMDCEHLDVLPKTMKQVSAVPVSVLPCVSHRCSQVVVVVSDCLRCDTSFQRVVPSLWSMASQVAREAPVCLHLGGMPEIAPVSREIEIL